ncbi:uncharacterized protein [Aegilops tauschii subsp. strangulata]|uniref:uncharacterized protein n=1 Tax=Aegilops tauschii subsp. strangulata TaxID=200361 RepID=UPI00098B76C4|nr:uncharacterized protein LOC109771490 [Aegilops tauschii subsp. strangulata]
MANYCFLVHPLSGAFDGCEFLCVPRTENEAADTLAKIGSTWQAIPSSVSLEHLRTPSIKPSPDFESIFISENPAAPPPNPEYPDSGPGAPDPGPRAASSDPRDKGIEILLDIHQGECEHHAASRSLVAKAFRHGFY